jgi:hypothetical protein
VKQAFPAEQQMRDQEVLRANRELAAYFKGRRTEREARAALKIIKAFIRDRERGDPTTRRPLPGAQPSKPNRTASEPNAGKAAKRVRRGRGSHSVEDDASRNAVAHDVTQSKIEPVQSRANGT